jgi:hypothetical protein
MNMRITTLLLPMLCCAMLFGCGSAKKPAATKPHGGGEAGTRAADSGTPESDASTPDAGDAQSPPGKEDAGRDAGATTCVPSTCKERSTECVRASCSDATGKCEIVPVSDGTSCGDSSDSECDAPDTCVSGKCEAHLAPSSDTCGDATETDCSHADHCDGHGECSSQHEASGTTCGTLSQECRNDSTCDGDGACVTGAARSMGTPCGDPSSGACDTADNCDGFGACSSNHLTLGTACGSASDTECDDADSCDDNGGCQINHAAQGAPCGNQGINCLVDDECDGSGACADKGPVAGCRVAATGIVSEQPNGTPVQHVTVEIMDDGGATPAVTAADGSFTLDVFPNTPLFVHAAAQSGLWGAVDARQVTPLSLSLGSLDVFADTTLDAVAGSVGGLPTIDTNLGLVKISVTGAIGGEVVQLSAASDASIAPDATGAFIMSDHIISSQQQLIVFINVALGTTTATMTGAVGETCTATGPGASTRPVLPHTASAISFACTGP